MRSIRLSKALAKNKVYVRNARTGQILLKMRTPGIPDRLLNPYSIEDEHRHEQTFQNLCRFYTPEQLKNSNLEDLILTEDIELADPDKFDK